MREVGKTRDEVAVAAGVTRETIRNWLTLRSRVDPERVSAVALALGEEPIEHYSMLGYLPEGALDASLEIERLRDVVSQLAIANGDLQQAAADPMSLLLRAALQHNIFVQIEPHQEGLEGFQIHALDTVSLVAAEKDFEPPPDVAHALQLAGSAKLTFPSAAALIGEKRAKKGIHYARPVLNAPKQPNNAVDIPYTTIGIVSTHLSSWATDTASLTASMLGFASTSVNYLSRLQYGESVRTGPRDRSSARAQIAGRLLRADPTRKTVWASADMGRNDPILESLGEDMEHAMLVYLRPTDRLHEYISHRPGNTRFTLGELEFERARFDRRFSESRIRTLVLDVGFPINITVDGSLTKQTRNEMLLRSMYLSTRIYDSLNAEFQLSESDMLGRIRGLDGFQEFISRWSERDFQRDIEGRFA
jgi:transcriptional regulator with XRE-family HTH domain